MDVQIGPGGQAQFPPDFLETLPFAVVVAKNMDGLILPQPAMKLLEKFTALGLGNLRFQRPLSQRTERIERNEVESGSAGSRRRGGTLVFAGRLPDHSIFPGGRLVILLQFNGSETTAVERRQKIRPGNEKRIIFGNLLFIGLGVNRQRFRPAQNENGFAGQMVQQG